RPNTLVWQVESHALQLLHAGRTTTQPFDALILATGATDRVLPFPGWTLPGVYTLGAAQVALKFQATLIGPRVVFAGTGPLLYLVAWQYASHGGQVAAVLDSAPLSAKLRAAPGMLSRPAVAAKGAYFLARLKLMGIAVHGGATLLKAEGKGRVSSLTWQAGGNTVTTECDAIGFGHGLRSETQLADLAGCEFEWSGIDQAWLPKRDDEGRSSVANVYLAGDGAGILGADAAELRGRLAAAAVLSDAGRRFDGFDPNAALQQLQKWQRFRETLELAFPFPHERAAEIADDVMLCRCEAITAGDFRGVCGEFGARDLNRAKAYCRLGMGRCQGRLCGPAAAEIMAERLGVSIDSVGRLRGQPPIKPVPVSALAAPEAGVTEPHVMEPGS
ncbi:MAG: FAD/NAD(P)-binding oxidoreductase, partial [Dongiaceae bacterium]